MALRHDATLTIPATACTSSTPAGEFIAVSHGNDRHSTVFLLIKPAYGELYRVLKPDSFAVSFYGWPKADRFLTAFREAGFRVVGHFVFPKRYTSKTRHVRYQHESAYLLAKGNPTPKHIIGDVLDWSYSGNKYHPTEKPLCVLTPLIAAFTPSNGLVLDPFAGSGSTLLAARALGCQYLGIELDEKYHTIACNRLAQARQRTIHASA